MLLHRFFPFLPPGPVGLALPDVDMGSQTKYLVHFKYTAKQMHLFLATTLPRKGGPGIGRDTKG